MACEVETAPSDHLTETQTKSSLYVGDLEPKVTSDDLKQVFSEIGKVSSARICRDSVTGHSLRYGYVNFVNADDASKALSTLNHTNLKGKSMRIMWCERDPLTRKNGTGNLFVKNLDPLIDSARLESIFGKFGTIVSCKVPEEDGKRKCFGFVRFEKEDSAMAALNAMHDTLLEGKKLYVAKFLNRVQRATTSKKKFTNLYVKNLDEDLTKDVLWEKFSEFGTVQNAVIMKNSEGKSKGFGFVNFESAESARKAAEALNGTLLGSKKLFVGRAQKKAEREEVLKHGKVRSLGEVTVGLRLIVKNLDPGTDDMMLVKHFSSCGKVTFAKVARGLDGISKGYGLVGFSKPAEAEKAFCALNGSTLQGKYISVGIERGRGENQRPMWSCCDAGSNRLPRLGKSFKPGDPLLESYSSLLQYPSSGEIDLSTLYWPSYTPSGHDSPWGSSWLSFGWVPVDPCSSYFDPYGTTTKNFCYPVSSQPEVYQHYPLSSAVQNFLQGNACTHQVPVKKVQQGNSTNMSRGKALEHGKKTQYVSTGTANKIKKLIWEEKCLKNTTAAGSVSKAPAATSSGFTAVVAAAGGNGKKPMKGHNQFLENLEPEPVQNPSSSVPVEVNEAGLIKLLASPNPQSSLVGKTVRVLKEVNVCSADDGVSMAQKCPAEV